ncbi:lipid-A-disaccharide synthase [Curvibacter sp. HBC61]|uniref:Lipid-A-disaccharide synthase n=1 Tax=Curvibacter cyanobacteriorum TaxID=3026422 RepID=A0ABT5MYD3_9BURK|nr:lipid-A-disaccharide synthase [Curvibacter sp. HBC61]MDD0837773.1 lipid-A-disaccharide synthase [Curvibacter sp. HBC61]
MTMDPRFAMVAGEASGDLLAGLLLDGLKSRWPALSAQGIGGPAMAQRGFEAWWPQHKLAVRGYVEVLPHLRELLAIRRALGDRLLAQRPEAFIGVDAPDFNFDLEIRLREAGVKTVHFVSPSFWAWRAKKVEKLRRAADEVLCIFPFEPELLAAQGVPATYVGHPIASVIPMAPDRAAARARLGLPAEGPVVALLPGSRRAEIRYLARRFFAAARQLQVARPQLHFVLPTLPALRAEVEAAARAEGLNPGPGGPLTVLEGQSHAALAACDVTLIASGTATLEAALFKRPMVIAYNMPWLSWQIMKGKKLQPWVGLPNILARDFVVPELLQDAATPDALARAVGRWLDHPAEVQALERQFTTLHEQLKRDTARLATDAIEKLLAR